MRQESADIGAAQALLQPRAQRLTMLADQCVQCGLCQPHCPTYALDQTEAESPRGRIAMARALALGELEANDAGLREHLEHCLGCLACEDVCPSKVRYGQLLMETRALLGPSPQRPRLLLALLKRPQWLRVLQRMHRLTGAGQWLPALARRMPANSAWRAALLALPTSQPLARTHALTARTHTRGQVALFPGCIASVYDAQALHAAERLLHAADFKVTRLPAFCCGALDTHDGNPDAAAAAAQRLHTAFAKGDVQALLTVTPGCLQSLRDALPSVPIDDALAFLARHGQGLRFNPLRERIALHLPCTQVHVAHAADAVRDLLLRVPGIDLAPLPQQPRCCGAAGSHMLSFPKRAAELRAAKLDQAQALSPQRLLSGNIGCRLHLAAGWRERGQTTPVQHPLTLLAQQLDAS